MGRALRLLYISVFAVNMIPLKIVVRVFKKPAGISTAAKWL